MRILKSNKKILNYENIFGIRKYIFPREYATDFDPVTKARGMIISIGGTNKFFPCEEPVELDYNSWSLLKDIGRIGRIFVQPIEEEDEREVE